MTRTHLDLDRIEGLARAATPGPWHADKNGLYVWAPSEKEGDFPAFDGNIEDPDQVVRARGWGYFTGNGHGALGLSRDEAVARQRANVNLVAALDPTTVLALITRIRELEEALDKLRSYSVDIEAGRINYRPLDHIAVADAALQRKTP